MDRCVANRGRPLHLRHDDPRLVGERPHLDPHRQPLAAEAGSAARRLPLRGRRPLARDRLLHRGRVARADHSGREAGMGSRSALCNARRPSRQSGCARCASRRVDARSRRPPADDGAAAGRRAGRGLPDDRGALRYRSATPGTRMADRGDGHERSVAGRSPRYR